MSKFLVKIFYVTIIILNFISLSFANDIKISVLNILKIDDSLKIQVSLQNKGLIEDELTAITTSINSKINIFRQTEDKEAIKKFNLHKIALPKNYTITMEKDFYILIEEMGASDFDLTFHFRNNPELTFKLNNSPKLIMEPLK